MINRSKKYIIPFIALILIFRCSPTDDTSPLPEDVFVKFYGDRAVENGKEVLATENGYLIFGSTTSEKFTAGDDEDSDFYLVFTDLQGNQSNQNAIIFDADANVDNTPDRTNQVPGRIKKASGGYIFIGTTTVQDKDASENDIFHKDIIVYKLNDLGEKTWSSTFNNSSTSQDFSDEEGLDIIEDTTDGGFVIVGTTSGVDIDKFGFTDLDDDPTDIFILKIDATGESRIWESTWGFNGADQGISILKNPNGGYAVLGSTNLDRDGAGGGVNIIFATTDEKGGEGTEQFKTFGSGPASAINDYPSIMKATSDGGFIIVGTSSVDEEDVLNDEVDNDNRIILMKVTATRTLTYFETININDLAGNLGSQVRTGDPIASNGIDVIELSTGGFLVGGKRIGGTLGETKEPSGEDIFLVKTNSFGQVVDENTGEMLDGLWETKFGGLGDDSANGLLELPDGKLIVVGTNDFGGTNSTMMMLMKLNRNGELFR